MKLLERIIRRLIRRKNFFLEKGNQIFIVRHDGSKVPLKRAYPGLAIECRGRNNSVEIAEGIPFENCQFKVIGEGIIFKFESTQRFVKNLTVDTWGSRFATVIFGQNFQCGGANVYITGENIKFAIGKNCLFSWDIFFWVGYSHSVIDNRTGRALESFDTKMELSDHVWVSHGVTFSKNIFVARNCIVASRAVVTKDFSEEGCIIGGNPARTVKKDIRWDYPQPEWYNAILDKKVHVDSLGYWHELVRDHHEKSVQAALQRPKV